MVFRKLDLGELFKPELPNLRLEPPECWEWILLDAGLQILDFASIGSMIGDWLATPIIPGDGMALAAGIQGFKASVKKKFKDKLYSEATLKAFQRQLKKDGRESLVDSKSSIKNLLEEHLKNLDKIKKSGGYTRSYLKIVLGVIRRRQFA